MDAPKITVPIHTDEHGRMMISGTRIPLDTVIHRHQQGRTPEQIHEGFPTLKLTDIYALISYYLSHQEEVDAYLRWRKEKREQVRREMEAAHPEMFVLPDKLHELLAKREE